MSINRHSPEWQVIEGYLKERLDKLRIQNDTSQSLEKTENIRGRIKEVKELLKLPEYEEEKAPTVRYDHGV